MSDAGGWPDIPTYDQAVAELTKQAHYLGVYTFPAMVKKRQLAQDQADFRLRCIEFSIETMRALRDGRPVPAARTF